MTGRFTSLVVVSLLGTGLFSLASDPARAQAASRAYVCTYAFNDPRIWSLALDGSESFVLFQPPASEWLPVGLDYDPGSALLYWTNGNFNSGTIRRAMLDGSGSTLLVSGLKLPRGLAVDPAGGKMYWANSPPAGNASGLIQRASLNGSGVETIFAVSPYDPTLSYVGRPAVDPVNGYVYFCAEDAIRRVPLDGIGPVQTIVRGVNTVTDIALDIANDHIYFVDGNTNTDLVGRANLDDTGFTVLVDFSPGVFGSSGLNGIDIDRVGGKLYTTDDITDQVSRCNLDGTDLEVIFTGGADSPAGITLDVMPQFPVQDCNDNGIRDLDDLLSGFSDDCNLNGIPDDCEDDPCAPIDYLVDHGSNPDAPERLLSGSGPGWEIFQPFDVSGAAITLARVELDGWTTSYHPGGFEVTLFPDDGTGDFPDESMPIEAHPYQLRFSPDTIAWVGAGFSATLEPGRYWLRLTPMAPAYAASVNVGLTGLPSISRRLTDGQLFPSSQSIALRIEAEATIAVDEASTVAGTPALTITVPNPFTAGRTIALDVETEIEIDASIFDATGRRVRSLAAEALAKGRHHLTWNRRNDAGRSVGWGVYFVRVGGVSADGRPVAPVTGRLVATP